MEKSCENCKWFYEDKIPMNLWCDMCKKNGDLVNWKLKELDQVKACISCKHFVTYGEIQCGFTESCVNFSKWELVGTPTGQGTTEAAKHYQIADMQPIEIMQAYLTKEQFIGFLRGNVIKYILRMGHKDDVIKDAEKACQYAEWLVKALRDERIVPGGKK